MLPAPTPSLKRHLRRGCDPCESKWQQNALENRSTNTIKTSTIAAADVFIHSNLRRAKPNYAYPPQDKKMSKFIKRNCYVKTLNTSAICVCASWHARPQKRKTKQSKTKQKWRSLWSYRRGRWVAVLKIKQNGLTRFRANYSRAFDFGFELGIDYRVRPH